MLTPATYGRYLEAFNGRDYDAVCTHFTPDVAMHTLGYTIQGHGGIRDFYGFFHQYFTEEITPVAMVGDAGLFCAEVVMRLTGLRDLDQATLDARGYSRFTAVPKGVSVDVPLFLHYALQDGLVRDIRCAAYIPPAQ